MPFCMITSITYGSIIMIFGRISPSSDGRIQNDVITKRVDATYIIRGEDLNFVIIHMFTNTVVTSIVT